MAPIARTRRVTAINIICGVDVSKQWLDAHVVPCGAAKRFANDAEGIGQLAAFCSSHAVELVVMEASGGYERTAFLLLWRMGQADSEVIVELPQIAYVVDPGLGGTTPILDERHE